MLFANMGVRMGASVVAVVLAACGAAVVAVAGAFVSCRDGGKAGNESDNVLVVSIEPLRFVVEEIVGDDFEVVVLVPSGASPETYEPTPRQIRAAEDARLVFSTGLIGFEGVMLERLPAPERVVDLSTGIELIAAEPHIHGDDLHAHDDSHAHGDKDPHTGAHTQINAHTHAGADPHIWIAPRTLARMAATAYGRIHELYPDSTSYTANYALLTERLAALDREVSERIALSSIRSFMIFHPGLTYYARDYGLRQIALEADGKEPSARQLAEDVALARAEGISKVFYQSEFPRRTVEVVAAEIGAEPVEIDILGYDVVGNILKITELITGIPALSAPFTSPSSSVEPGSAPSASSVAPASTSSITPVTPPATPVPSSETSKILRNENTAR